MQQIGLDATLNNVPDFTGGIDKMNRSVDAFATDATSAGKALASFEASAERAAKMQALTDKLDQQQKALGILQQELDKTTAKYGEGSTQAQKKQLALETLTKAIDRTETQLKTEATALDLEKQAAAEATPVVDKLGTTTKQAGDDAEKGGHGFDVFGEIVTGALRKIGELAIDALLKAGQAVAGFAKDSIGLAGDFQAGMNEFRVAAGKDIDAKGIQQFHDLFIQLGKDLPVSTADVEQAAIEMVKGGLDPAILAAGGLKQNIQFAAAAMKGDLVGAATISAKIVAGWADVGATATDKANLLTHATDMLTKAANASSVDVHELSLGLFNVQATAKSAGIGIDDVTTVLAELAGDFSSASQAGNSMASFITRLQPTTKDATAAMKDLGLYTDKGGSAFYDAKGNFVGFQQASQLLQESLKGLTNEQKQSYLQTIFQKDAIAVANGLAERGAAGYDAMAASLQEAMGVAEAGATVQDGFNTALKNAQGGVEALQITLGEALLPVLTDVFNFVNDQVLSVLIDFSNALLGNDEALNTLSPTMQAIVSVIDVLVADVQDVVGAFTSAGASSSDFASALGYLADDLGLPGDLISDIVFAVQDLVAWFGSATSESGALDHVLVDLSDTWDNVLYAVQDVAAGYQAIIRAVLPIVQKFIADHGAQIAAFFQSAYDHVMVIVNTALQLYDAIVPKILGSVAKWISDHATGIQAVLSGAWQAITAIIDGALAIIEGVLKVALDLINGNWAKAWDDMKTMSVAVVLDIQQAISGFFDIIAGLFNTNMADIAAVWQHNWDMLVEIAMKIGDKMMDVGTSIVQGIKKGISDAWGALEKWVSDKIASLFDVGQAAQKGGSPAMLWTPVGGSIVEGIMLGLKEGWGGVTDLVGSLVPDLVDQFSGIGDKINSAIANSFGSTASIDRQIAKNLDRFKDVLPQYQQYTQGALKEAEMAAREFADPAQGAKYFKLKSDQILEYAKLQKDLNDAATQEDRDRIQAQMLLINAAQQAELSAFDATKAAVSPMQDIAKAVKAMLDSIGPVLADDPRKALVDQLQALWVQLQTPVTTQRPVYNPNAPGPVTNTTNLNMPIYTNNTPSAMQSSMAIASAALL